MENRHNKQSPLKVSVRNEDTFPNTSDQSAQGKHKLATIMFSDICGFTKMMGSDEVKTMQIVERNKRTHQKYIHNHNGNLIKEMGDGLMASFESTLDAVRCAKEIMEEVNSEGDYHLHIGVHLGDIIFTPGDIFGDGVNIASRINSFAQEGEIIISEDVWKNIKNQIEFKTEYVSKSTLKNVDLPIKLHRVVLDSEKHKIQFKALLYTHSKAIKIGVTGTLLVSILLFAYYVFQNTPGGFIGNDINTIAVLPFENRSHNQEFEYLREGLAEDVISELFQLSSLSVISSRSTFRFKDTEKSIRQISRELKSDIVVLGNYTIEDEKIEVKVEVIKGRDHKIMNYTSISGNLEMIKDISSQIGQKIYETLDISMDQRAGVNSISDKKNINIEAYKYYAIGKSAMRDHTGQKLEDITKYFKAAIEIDPTYVDPYIGMAEAYIFDVNRGYISPAEASQKARKYALMAEKIKPGSGEVSGLLAIFHCLDFQFEASVPYFERSLEISPNFNLTYHWYSFALEGLGDFDKAEKLQKKATVLDPLNAFNDIYLAMNYIFQRRYLEAGQIIDNKLALDPNHMEVIWLKSVLLIQQKKYHEAYEVLLQRGVGMETNFVAGFIYAKIGQEEKAKIVLNNILATAKKRYVPPSQIAILLCGLEQYKEALDWVEEAFLIHDQWIGWLKYTTMTEPIKDEPRFVSLMEKLGWE